MKYPGKGLLNMTSSKSRKNKNIISKVSYLLVTLFLFEGILGKAALPEYSMRLKTHILLTFFIIIALIVLDISKPKRKRTIEFSGTYRKIQYAILSLILIGFISSALRVYWKSNLMFFLIWAANFYAIWWSIPRLMYHYSISDRIKLIQNILIFVLVVSGVMHLADLGIVQGRLGGIFANPTIAARLIAITFLFYLIPFLIVNKYSKKTLLIIGLSLTLMIMTKTRASLFATLIGAALIFLLALYLNKPFTRRRIYALITTVCVMGSLLLFIYNTGLEDLYQKSRKYIRLDKDIATIYLESRAANWRAGYQNMSKYGLFGLGFMSKFGITDSFYTGSRNVNQNIIPRYNWATTDDPLNMVLSVAKQQGWISSILYILFLLLIIKNSINVRSEIGKLSALAVVALGLIFGILDGNWMTSFGDPVDRISMVTIAMVLSTTNFSKTIKQPQPSLSIIPVRT